MIVLAGGDLSRPTYIYVTGGWGGGAENQLLVTCRPQVQAEGHSPFRVEELFRVTKELPETYQSRESAPSWLKIPFTLLLLREQGLHLECAFAKARQG